MNNDPSHELPQHEDTTREGLGSEARAPEETPSDELAPEERDDLDREDTAPEQAAGEEQGQREQAEAEAAEPPLSPAAAALDALPKRDLIDRHLRLMADQRRMRQRSEIDIAEARRDATQRTLGQWLEVLDSVERGLEAAGEGDEDNPWRQGMEGIRRQMLDVLARFGVKPFAPEGEPFDATVMEALCTAPAPGKEDDTVAQVERKGYRSDDGILRPARVIVVRNA